MCDLAIVLYDTTKPDCFEKAVEIQMQIDVPSVFIGRYRAHSCILIIFKNFSPSILCTIFPNKYHKDSI